MSDKYFINKANWQKDYRNEQVLLVALLKKKFPKDMVRVKMEHEVTNLHDVDDIRAKPCKPDVVILPHHAVGCPCCAGQLAPTAFRLMGKSHKRGSIKDEDQRILLEGNGWIVYDFWWDEFPMLWALKYDDAEKELDNWLKEMKEMLNAST